MRRDDLQGKILDTGSNIDLGTVILTLGCGDAYAVCNALSDVADSTNSCVTKDQRKAIKLIAQDLAMYCDHPARVRKIIAPKED